MSNIIKNSIIVMIMSLVIISIIQGIFKKINSSNKTIDYTTFMKELNKNKIKEIKINKRKITIKNKNGNKYITYIPINDPKLIDILLSKNIKIKGYPMEKQNIMLSIFISWFPMILLIVVWFFFIKQIHGNNGKNTIFFGKNKAKIMDEKKIKITFSDIAGCNEAKEEVSELVQYLKEPKKFQRLGGKIPKGILMIGPPGTGKTLLAKAIAGESKVPFFSISGSDFVEMFVGVGASRVRDMFEQAKKSSPCIIFIDEIDAVGRQRGTGLGGGHDEREQTLNQMLVEMDGFEENEGIIIIAATNRPDVLDPALLRPGRFDRQVIVELPDINGREQILKVHSKQIPLSNDINLKIIARGTPGFSGADLANLVNEATLFAAKQNKNTVSIKEFEKAKDKILMGVERKSIILTDKQKELTAYHEAGHVIVGRLVPEHDPVHKATIIPRGKSLGTTFFLPENDIFNITKLKLESQISTLYGGRVAEEIIYGKNNISTGSYNDIKTATTIAKNMVTKWGFSSKLGPLLYLYDNDEEIFIGKTTYNKKRQISENTAKIIDKEIKIIIKINYLRAKKILINNIDILHAMKKKLIKYETINSNQINSLMNKKK